MSHVSKRDIKAIDLLLCDSEIMSTIKRVAAAMERIAPLSLADRSWDNVGILVEAPVLSSTAPIVMLTNDLTGTPTNMDSCGRH